MTLHGAILTYIANSHASAWRDFHAVKAKAISLGLRASAAGRWKSPGEPAFVAQLLSDSALSELRDALARHLPSSLCTGEPLLSTAFIHQKPKVRFGATEIELGDLLIVRHHFAYGRPEPEGRALLLQAKACASPRTGALRNHDAEQLRLYREWPVMRFPHGEVGNAPNGNPDWDFKLGPPAAIDAGCYGIVFSREPPLPLPARSRPAFPEDSPWSAGLHNDFRSASVDASKSSLAAVLTGLIEGKRGRLFEAIPDANDHWSTFVNEILKNAASESWRYRLHRLDIEARQRLQRVALLSSTMPSLAFTVSATLDAESRHPRRRRNRGFPEWVVRTLDDGGGRALQEGPQNERPRARGIQMLYLATFGSERLADRQRSNDDGGR
jgi:hypothetical protein